MATADRTAAALTSRTADKPQCQTEVVLFSADGTRVKSVPALDRGNAVTGIDWLGNERIGIDTHINPSVGQDRVVDAATGEELASQWAGNGSLKIAGAGVSGEYAVNRRP